MRFAGADASPALTPTWRSNTWANPGQQNGGDGRERSPDLKEDLGQLLNEEEVRNNEQQLDRDWYDRCGGLAPAGHTRGCFEPSNLLPCWLHAVSAALIADCSRCCWHTLPVSFEALRATRIHNSMLSHPRAMR